MRGPGSCGPFPRAAPGRVAAGDVVRQRRLRSGSIRKLLFGLPARLPPYIARRATPVSGLPVWSGPAMEHADVHAKSAHPADHRGNAHRRLSVTGAAKSPLTRRDSPAVNGASHSRTWRFAVEGVEASWDRSAYRCFDLVSLGALETPEHARLSTMEHPQTEGKQSFPSGKLACKPSIGQPPAFARCAGGTDPVSRPRRVSNSPAR